jgi:hypothetical protein
VMWVMDGWYGLMMFDDVSWFLGEHQVFPEPKEPDWINSCSHWNRSQCIYYHIMKPSRHCSQNNVSIVAKVLRERL